MLSADRTLLRDPGVLKRGKRNIGGAVRIQSHDRDPGSSQAPLEHRKYQYPETRLAQGPCEGSRLGAHLCESRPPTGRHASRRGSAQDYPVIGGTVELGNQFHQIE